MEKKPRNDDVVVNVSNEEEVIRKNCNPQIDISIQSNNFYDPNLDLIALEKTQSPRISNASPPQFSGVKSPTFSNKPPKIPAEPSSSSQQPVMRKRSLTRSVYSAPKSRLAEPVYTTTTVKKVDDGSSTSVPLPASTPPRVMNPASPRDVRSAPITPKTPLMSVMAGGGADDEEDDDVYTAEKTEVSQHGKKWKCMLFSEWTACVCILGFLVASLTVDRLKNRVFWSAELWKWSVLVMVIFCGRLFTEWFINVLAFLIERNFLLKKKVLYFVYALKRPVQVFIYLALVLSAWGLLFNRGVKRSRRTDEAVDYITRALGCCLLGAFIWMMKTLCVKLLASSFHVTRFFDRIQECIFHQYVLQTLSGPPLIEMGESISRDQSSSAQLSFRSVKKSKGKDKEKAEVIDVEKLHKIKQGKVSPWTMKGLVKIIQTSGLTTLSDALEDADDEGNDQQKGEEITNEAEAKYAAKKIFRNVAKSDPKNICEEDLLRFMKKEEVDNVFPFFQGGAETKKITKVALRNWVVKVYQERKSLAFSLKDTKTAVEELNKIISGIVLVVTFIVWLLLMGLATTKVLVFISSQLLLVAFMFGNTCKMIFEAIIFVFIMHPYDVGDRCVIDGVQMTVEEMNILTTIFLRYDNEKIIYPNSVLACKPISNFYRSPEMGDSVEFCVDLSTSMDTIGLLKGHIKAYLEGKPLHWRPGHSVVVRDIEDMNKMKMGLYVTHTINFQSGERGGRRSDLVIELKRIFEELGIKYRLLPQDVNVSYVGSSTPSTPPPSRL